jgi:hypothetical protein
LFSLTKVFAIEGAYHDLIEMGMLKQEWDASQQSKDGATATETATEDAKSTVSRRAE